MTDAATGPIVAVKIGQRCPRCGGTHLGKQLAAVHWILAIVLFPVGLLVLLRPWSKCESCSFVFAKGWLKPGPADEATADDDVSPTCWYCQTVASSRTLDEDLPLHKGLDETQVTIPKCAVCKSVHSSKTRARWIGVGIALLPAVIFGASQGVGTVLFVGVFLAPIGWLLGGYAGKKTGQARADAAGLEVKPDNAWTQYPPITQLMGDGWELGDAGDERKRRKIAATKRPTRCPVCDAYTGSGTLVHTATLLGGSTPPTTAERCVACGKWGCRLCMHFHTPDGTVIWKGVTERIDRNTVKVYKNPEWRHNACCECGFGTINGRTVRME